MANYVNLLDIIYPVGSVYISFNDTSPSSFIGGTWEQLNNVFLYGTSGGIGVTGGEATHLLSTAEIPRHNHALRIAVIYGGNAAMCRSVFATNSTFWNSGDIDNGLYDSNNSTSWVGSSQAHNNMPPYITCRIYKKTK